MYGINSEIYSLYQNFIMYEFLNFWKDNFAQNIKLTLHGIIYD